MTPSLLPAPQGTRDKQRDVTVPLRCHRWELLAYLSCTGAYQVSPRGDSVTTLPTHTNTSANPALAFSSLSLPHLALPSEVEPGVLSVPDGYRLTLKHKRGERRNTQIDRHRLDGNTHRVGGDGYRLSSSVIMLSISIFKLLLLLLSPFKIHQRKRNKRDTLSHQKKKMSWWWCLRNKIIWLHKFW